jgi:hypothetical protein
MVRMRVYILKIQAFYLKPGPLSNDRMAVRKPPWLNRLIVAEIYHNGGRVNLQAKRMSHPFTQPSGEEKMRLSRTIYAGLIMSLASGALFTPLCYADAPAGFDAESKQAVSDTEGRRLYCCF